MSSSNFSSSFVQRILKELELYFISFLKKTSKETEIVHVGVLCACNNSECVNFPTVA